MAIHSIVEIEKIKADEVGNIESVVGASDLEQGSLINLGALVAGERELYNATVPVTATLATAEVLLVASVEELYIVGQNKKDFVNIAGAPARAFHLEAGDYYKVSSQLIDGIPADLSTAVGKYITVQNGSVKPVYSATVPTGVRFYAQIVEATTVGFDKFPAVAVRVIAA